MSRKCTHRSASSYLLSSILAVHVLFGLSQPFHFTDVFLEEDSKLRRVMLKRYARFEVQLLRVFYWILNSPLMSNKWTRKGFYYCITKFMAERAIASQVMTLGEIERFIIDELPEDSRIAVGPCRCRLATRACDHPVETDIVILTGTSIWLELFPKDYRVIEKDEALRIVRECYEMGLVPMLDRHMYWKATSNYFVICNCCGCSCLPIIGMRTFKRDGYHYIPSAYRSVVDASSCKACGTCVEVCSWNERLVRAGRARVLDCHGCGQCVAACPNSANSMINR